MDAKIKKLLIFYYSPNFQPLLSSIILIPLWKFYLLDLVSRRKNVSFYVAHVLRKNAQKIYLILSVSRVRVKYAGGREREIRGATYRRVRRIIPWGGTRFLALGSI